MRNGTKNLFMESAMKCPKCGYENGPQALACGLCTELLKPKGGTEVVAPAEGQGAPEPPQAQGEPGQPDWSSFGPPSGEPFCFETGRMSFAMPKACACCLGPYLDEFPVSASVTRHEGSQQVTHTTTWQFPFCLDCTGHLKGYQRGWAIAVGACLLTFVGFIYGASKDAEGTYYGIMFAAAMAVLVAVRVVTSQIFPKKGHRCASLGRPVTVTGPHGGAYRFTFYNPTWGRIFAEFNS